MTLLDYALHLVDEKLADLKVVEDRLVRLMTLVTTPDQQADVRRLAIDYADQRNHLLQQKTALLNEVLAYHVERVWATTPSTPVH